VVQALECLLCKCAALNSNLKSTKKKKKPEKKEKQIFLLKKTTCWGLGGAKNVNAKDFNGYFSGAIEMAKINDENYK
jgi:hypothetical protein